MSREYRSYDPGAGFLFPRRLDELISESDPVRMVFDATERLKLSAFSTSGRQSGEQPYSPLLMVRLLLWAYANGVYSSRKIAAAVGRDITFMFLAGGCRPSYRSISRFRCDHCEALGAIFHQVFRLCAEAGLVRLGHVALDGTVLKANTSKHKAMSYGRMLKDEARLKAEIDSLLAQATVADAEENTRLGSDDDGVSMPAELARREGRLAKIEQARQRMEAEARQQQGLRADQAPQIADKEQRSFADTEARIMPAKRGGFEYAYNAQLAVDEHAGVIVAADLDNHSNDGQHLQQMVDAIREQRGTVGQLGDGATTKITADAGYFSAEQIEASDGDGIELFISPGREGKDDKAAEGGGLFDVTHFKYEPDRQRLICPQGRELLPSKRSPTHFTSTNCSGCPLAAQCKKPSEDRRKIRLMRPAGAAMRTKMQLPASQEVYRRRKWVVEPRFGELKWNRGFRGLSLRGQRKARGEYLFVCAVHNLMRWITHQMLAPSRPCEASA